MAPRARVLRGRTGLKSLLNTLTFKKNTPTSRSTRLRCVNLFNLKVNQVCRPDAETCERITASSPVHKSPIDRHLREDPGDKKPTNGSGDTHLIDSTKGMNQ